MEKTQAFFISKKISEATSAENLAQILKEMGFNSSYLTLEDKKPQLEEIFETIKDEQDRLRYNPNATQIWGKRGYSLEDLYLVRTTDVINAGHLLTTPKDGQVLSHMDFAFKANDAARRAVGLTSDSSHQEYMAKRQEIKKIEDGITPYLRQYRSTKHFTINTLVSANSGGSWDNMPYILLEPMKHHLQDANLSHIAPHDTFFRGDVQLTKPTLIVQQKYLADLLAQNNPTLTQTLMDTELIILDDHCHEHGALSEHVAYVLREMKNAPFYICHDHGVNISSREGVFQPLFKISKDKGISYGSDHCYTDEYKMDSLHFIRNIAEDSYSYLSFVRSNPRFNLSEQQIAVIDNALNAYHKTCERAAEKGIPLDFTEENTPDASYEHLQEFGDKADYNRSYNTFNELYYIVENAFADSGFYETVDISVLTEETTRYNAEYKAALEKSAEYSRAEFFKPEISTTPVEE